jgi:hypothetical protein
MTYTTALTPTKQHPTCANCEFFTGFNGENRGDCEVFRQVFKSHNLRTNDCDRSIESLQKQPKTLKVIALVITTEVEDDGSGHAVPVDSRTEEMMVAQPLKGLIKALVAQRDDLQGYEVADFTVPDGGYEV